MTAYNIIGADTMVGGMPEDVSQVLANFQALASVLNGGLTDYNIAAGANINPAKISGGTLPAPTIPMVTSLPATGSDGQELVYTDNMLNGNFHWHLRYNGQSTNPNKWESIGSSVLAAGLGGVTWTNSSTFVDLDGPSVTLPVNGVFEAFAVATVGTDNAVPGKLLGMALSVGGNVYDQGLVSSIGTTNLANDKQITAALIVGGTAGQPARLQYRTSDGSYTMYAARRYISIRPIRVG